MPITPLMFASEPPFGGVIRTMSKLMDQMQKGYCAFSPKDSWTPPVNLYETDSAYVVCVDLAGIDKDKIDLTLADNQLKLRGQRAVPVPGSQEQPQQEEASGNRLRVHMMEIDYGPFCREVDLPANVDRDRISAAYRNGMLWVDLPKK